MDQESVASTRERRDWWVGVGRAVPVMLGYVPVGFAFGVLSQKAGLSLSNTLLMSLLVYAGSSQLIAVGLFAAAAPALSIVITTFIVNMRHLLMSAAIAPALRRWNMLERAVFAFELTDETFALHTTRFAHTEPSKAEVLTVNLLAQITWVLGTWLGTAAGQLITDVRPLALDFALPALFIALLMLQLRNRVQLVVAMCSGCLAVLLLLLGMQQWHVVLATIAGASLGVGLERWTNTPSS